MIFAHSQQAPGGEPNKQTQIPIVDLSSPNCKTEIIQAFQELGFCKVINHGVASELVTQLEDEATNFFNLPLDQKQRATLLGYGNKLIGRNGDIGWLEYLLFSSSPHFMSNIVGPNFSCVVSKYIMATKKVACRVLEELAEGLNMDKNDAFSRMLKDDKSDSYFRMNHYPPCPSQLKVLTGGRVVGFGEHTDPQIISVLRSNDACGLEILTQDGNWLSVASDPDSFFIIVGDSLQVMSNGRFKSVRHRVVAQETRSRMSMIYLGGPALTHKIAPLRSLMKEGEESAYDEFTWREYKMAAYTSRLADYRLGRFEKIP